MAINEAWIEAEIGAPQAREADVDGGYIMNVSGILHLALETNNLRSRTLLRAFEVEWRRLLGSPIQEDDRKMRAFRAAEREMLRIHGPPPANGETAH